MKKTVFICLVALYIFSAFSAFAADGDQKLFVKSVPMVKILSHELGYRILYYKVGMGLGTINIPYGWFNSAAGKARIFWGNNHSYPYFSIYWRDGSFDHIELFVQENISHDSWGILFATRADVQADFDVTPDTFVVEF